MADKSAEAEPGFFRKLVDIEIAGWNRQYNTIKQSIVETGGLAKKAVMAMFTDGAADSDIEGSMDGQGGIGQGPTSNTLATEVIRDNSVLNDKTSVRTEDRPSRTAANPNPPVNNLDVHKDGVESVKPEQRGFLRRFLSASIESLQLKLKPLTDIVKRISEYVENTATPHFLNREMEKKSESSSKSDRGNTDQSKKVDEPLETFQRLMAEYKQSQESSLVKGRIMGGNEVQSHDGVPITPANSAVSSNHNFKS